MKSKKKTSIPRLVPNWIFNFPSGLSFAPFVSLYCVSFSLYFFGHVWLFNFSKRLLVGFLFGPHMYAAILAYNFNEVRLLLPYILQNGLVASLLCCKKCHALFNINFIFRTLQHRAAEYSFSSCCLCFNLRTRSRPESKQILFQYMWVLA